MRWFGYSSTHASGNNSSSSSSMHLQAIDICSMHAKREDTSEHPFDLSTLKFKIKVPNWTYLNCILNLIRNVLIIKIIKSIQSFLNYVIVYIRSSRMVILVTSNILSWISNHLLSTKLLEDPLHYNVQVEWSALTRNRLRIFVTMNGPVWKNNEIKNMCISCNDVTLWRHAMTSFHDL